MIDISSNFREKKSLVPKNTNFPSQVIFKVTYYMVCSNKEEIRALNHFRNFLLSRCIATLVHQFLTYILNIGSNTDIRCASSTS